MRSDEGITYEVAGANAVTPGQNSVLLLSILTSRLFKKIDLSSISSNVTIDATNKFSATNPCPLIKSGASNLYDCFKDGLQSEANFGEDKGNDGEIDGGDNSVR